MDSKNNRPVFHRILFMELAPWLETNKPVEKFAAQINKVKNVNRIFLPGTKLNFHTARSIPKPFTTGN